MRPSTSWHKPPWPGPGAAPQCLNPQLNPPPHMAPAIKPCCPPAPGRGRRVMPTLPRRELTCTHPGSSRIASSPVSQCISINQALACPPPSPAAGFGGSPVTPGRWCGDSHPFPRNCCSRPSVRQLKSPRSCLGAAAQHLHPGTPAAACSADTGGTGRIGGGWGASNSPELVAVLPAAYPNHA